MGLYTSIYCTHPPTSDHSKMPASQGQRVLSTFVLFVIQSETCMQLRSSSKKKTSEHAKERGAIIDSVTSMIQPPSHMS
eukprot:2226467-Amphidinium_carterae.1